MELPENIGRPKIPWWAYWRKKRANLYSKGYCWAAGQLISGDNIDNIQSMVNCSKAFGDYNEFDQGLEEAIMNFQTLKGEA